MKSLPIGKQDFKEMIESNYLYIDKTKYIYELAKLSTPYFISRPRRFGKSLTISKLYYLFKGEKELFKDTWIYDKWDWKEYPVIRMSMSTITTNDKEEIKTLLLSMLYKIANKYDVEIESNIPGYALLELMENLHEKTGEKVVVLIDEYEKPILNNLFDKEKAKEIREIFKNFYDILKDSEQHMRFLLLTGITKFTKTGVFSTLNHLMDLTISSKCSEMFGYTQEELEYYFKDYIEKAINQLNTSKEELLKQIKEYYNGFSFDGEHKVYNPFSILNFFFENKFQNYWIDSGASSFIINYAKNNQIKPTEIVNRYIQPDTLTTYEIESAPPESFLLQAGYLTFKSRHENLGYLLDYPNNEVRRAFSKLLMLGPLNQEENLKNHLIENLFEGLENRDFEQIYNEMIKVISNIPSNLFEKKKTKYETEKQYTRKQENYYHSIILTLLYSAGINVKAEELTYRGRSDLTIEYKDDVYIIELKLDKAEKALQQIKEKGYHHKYKGKNIYLIGIEIDADNKILKEYIIENKVNL